VNKGTISDHGTFCDKLVSRHPLAGGETLYPNSLRGVSDFTRPDRLCALVGVPNAVVCIIISFLG
jgi:hypothetical protein